MRWPVGGFREQIQLERTNRTRLQCAFAYHRFRVGLWRTDFWQPDNLAGFGHGNVVDGIRPFARFTDNAAQFDSLLDRRVFETHRKRSATCRND